MKIWKGWTIALIAAATLAACGGGGSDSGTTGSTSTATAAVSSGTISAFGSVFVNGHEFSTAKATVKDSDTGETLSHTTLEVGQSVDVKSASDSTSTSPKADEIHLHALARGFVDASDTGAGTLTVMGQTVALTSATNYSDQRACTTATTSACTPVSGQDGLASTAADGASAASFVTVYGYLFSASSGSAQIVATLVRVSDLPDASTSTKVPRYKVEGLVSAVGTSSVTIGGLTVDLAAATCRNSSGSVACASAFSAGQVVSAWSATAPALPATTFAASVARQRSQLPLAADGSTVELEGRVSAVNGSNFVLRGMTVDASGLPSGTTLPAVGDIVEVKGTLASSGASLTATELKVMQAAGTRKLALEGDFSAVAAGSSADTYTLQLLGRSVTVNASTRLADRQAGGRERHGDNSSSTTSNPFNISTFATYLAASTSKHLMVKVSADASGNLTALSLTVMPASTVAAMAGTVDATPAPVNGATGTPSTFSVGGVAVSADATLVVKPNGATATLAAGSRVLVVGTFASGTLTVASSTGSTSTTTAAKSSIADSKGNGESGSKGSDLHARHSGSAIVIVYASSSEGEREDGRF